MPLICLLWHDLQAAARYLVVSAPASIASAMSKADSTSLHELTPEIAGKVLVVLCPGAGE